MKNNKQTDKQAPGRYLGPDCLLIWASRDERKSQTFVDFKNNSPQTPDKVKGKREMVTWRWDS